MGVNKVIYYGEVLVDMSQVTVTPEKLGKGETALDAKGDLITGTHECEETEPKLQSKTVTPTTSLQTVNPDSGYDGLSKVTVNAMPVATQATPSISVSAAGLITATATQPAGYVSAGTKSGTKQLTTQAAQTITPSTSDKTIASGRYLTGTQTIKGDSNLKAENIKSGVSIFGVAGSYEGSGGGSGGSVETCTVTITYSVARSAMLLWYVVGYDTEAGEIIQHYNSADEGVVDTLTFDDVICGSIFILYCEGMRIPSSCAVTGGAELIQLDSMPGMSGTRIYVKAPVTAGSVCTCTIT